MNSKAKIGIKLCILVSVLFSSVILCGFDLNPFGTPEAFVVNNSPTIIIGDSRMVLVHDAVGDAGCDWMATAGAGFDCMSSFARLIDSMDINGKKIVISIGINDINALSVSMNPFFKYQNFMSTKAQEWIEKGATVYFTDIPGITPAIKDIPVCAGTCVESINEHVRQFNNLAKSGGFPANIKHINLNISDDLYVDGLHYNPEACKYVFDRIMQE